MFWRAIFVLVVAFGVTNSAHARSEHSNVATAADHKELARILRPHVWHGKGVNRGVRAAAGDPKMAVFDRRIGRSLLSQCSFIVYKNKRAMVCNSY